jgi:hypothetical protein
MYDHEVHVPPSQFLAHITQVISTNIDTPAL